MPKLSVAVAHELGQEQASAKLKGEASQLQEAFSGQYSDYEETWEDHQLAFRFTTFGFNVKGTVSVEPSEVRVDLDLPIAAMMFKGVIEERIRGKMEEMLA